MKNYPVPTGIRFFDAVSKLEMILVTEGEHKDWIVVKYLDGSIKLVRIATPEDRKKIEAVQ